MVWLLIQRQWSNLARFAVSAALASIVPYLLFSFREPRMLSQVLALSPGIVDVFGDLAFIARMPDDEVVRELTLVRGIGEWTAHMFLMFQCGRLDVWPTGDLGVRAGFGRLYGIEPPPTPKVLLAAGEPFRPLRSLVAWWCWRAVDTTVPA